MDVKTKPTNVKNDSWYEEYYLTGDEKDKSIYINELKRDDECIDFFEAVHHLVTPLERERNKYARQSLAKYHLKGYIPEELDKRYEELSEKIDKIPTHIPKEDWREYWNLKQYNNEIFKFYSEYNNISGNKLLISRCKEVLSFFNEFDINNDIKFCIEQCHNVLENGYLITKQLNEIISCIETIFIGDDGKRIEDIGIIMTDEPGYEDIYDIKKIKRAFKKDFNFEYSEREVLDLIRKEANWRDIERDIEIYIEREKGRLLEDIAGDYKKLKLKAISNICTKVKGAIIRYKGKLFEKRYSQYLKELNIYDKVVWDGTSGRPDILAFKDNELHIFSLKNLQIDRKKYVIKKKDLEPEFKRAYNGLLESDDVFLKLVVFDNLTDKIIERDLDFRNPEDVIITS